MCIILIGRVSVMFLLCQRMTHTINYRPAKPKYGNQPGYQTISCISVGPKRSRCVAMWILLGRLHRSSTDQVSLASLSALFSANVMSEWHIETASMGLLPDTYNCGCACAGNAGNVFPATAGKRSRHASRHVRDARAVMHAGIAN